MRMLAKSKSASFLDLLYIVGARFCVYTIATASGEGFFKWLQNLFADRVTLNFPKLFRGASYAVSNGCCRRLVPGIPRGKRARLFFFNDTATTEIYTLSLHDALPISGIGIAGWTNGSHHRNQQSRSGGYTL